MIDTEHLCPKCMSEWVDPTKPCPSCGFNGEDEITGEQWEDFTVVEGKYLVGAAIAQNELGVTYIAMDLAEEKIVTLRPTAEGFAVGEYAPTQPKAEPEAPNENGGKKRSRLLPILGGAGVIALCAVLGLLFAFGGATSKEDNNTAILRALGENARLCDDGSLWLKTASRYSHYPVDLSTEDEVSFDDWNTDFIIYDWEYEFADDGKFTVSENLSDDELYKLNYEWQDGAYTALYEGDNLCLSVSFTFDEGGGYTKKTVQTVNDETYESEQKYDSNGNLLRSTTNFGAESEVTFTYDDSGNLIRSVNKTVYSDGESLIYEEEYEYEYSDKLISRIIATNDNGNVSVTEYEYDRFGNPIATYNYYATSPSSNMEIYEFYCDTYEKYVLENGVYVATGEISDASNVPFPEKYAPTVIPGDYNGDVLNNERDAVDSSEVQSLYIIELLGIYDYRGDSLIYRFQHDSSERIWDEMNDGNIDFVSDVTIVATGEGSDYLIVLPQDDKIDINAFDFETFCGICCRDENTLKEITKVLYDDEYYATESEAYAFLKIFFDSYDEKEDSTWYCGTESYAQFLIYEQYMKLWAKNNGRNYELTYLPTGEVRTAH